MTEWATPALSVVGLVVTVAAARLILRTPQPMSRIIGLATLALVALCLAVSSLIYPSVISTEGARFSVSLARVAIVIGGVAVLYTIIRTPEADA